MSAGARKDIDFAALMSGELNNDVRGGSETVEAQALAGPDVAQPQCPMTDDAGAEQGSGFDIRKTVRQPVGKGFGDKCDLSVPPIRVIAGKTCPLA